MYPRILGCKPRRRSEFGDLEEAGQGLRLRLPQIDRGPGPSEGERTRSACGVLQDLHIGGYPAFRTDSQGGIGVPCPRGGGRHRRHSEGHPRAGTRRRSASLFRRERDEAHMLESEKGMIVGLRHDRHCARCQKEDVGSRFDSQPSRRRVRRRCGIFRCSRYGPDVPFLSGRFR